MSIIKKYIERVEELNRLTDDGELIRSVYLCGFIKHHYPSHSKKLLKILHSMGVTPEDTLVIVFNNKHSQPSDFLTVLEKTLILRMMILEFLENKR